VVELLFVQVGGRRGRGRGRKGVVDCFGPEELLREGGREGGREGWGRPGFVDREEGTQAREGGREGGEGGREGRWCKINYPQREKKSNDERSIGYDPCLF